MSKTFSTCSENILKKQNFPKILLRVWYILGLWAFFFWLLGTKIPIKFSKLLPTPSDGHFDGKQFFLKIFFNLFDFGRSSRFWLTTIFLLQNCQNCFLWLQGNTLISKISWKTLLRFFRTLSKLFFDFRKNFYREVVQTVLYVFRKPFEDADFFNFLILVQSQILSNIVSDIRHKFFRKVVETAFSMSRRTIWWKAFFRQVLQLIFGIWSKHFMNLGEKFTEK